LDSRNQARWLRAFGAARHREVRLFTRNGHDWTERFPLIFDALSALKVTTCLLDATLDVAIHENRTSTHGYEATTARRYAGIREELVQGAVTEDASRLRRGF
jgi:ATP-dependent DNA ligase